MLGRASHLVLRTRVSGVLVLIAALGVWEITARTVVLTPAFPQMSDVFAAWGRMIASGEILLVMAGTLRRMLIGFGLAGVVGVLIGLLMGRFRVMHSLLEPTIEILRPIPSPAYVPLVILFLGLDDAMKIFVVFFASLFPIIINTYTGVRSVDPVLVDTGRTFGLGPWQITFKVVVPASLPYVFAGLRISLAIALILVIIAEMVAGVDGAGHFIVSNQQVFQVARTYAGVLSLGVLGYLLNRAMLGVEGRVIGWHIKSRAMTMR